MTLKEYAKKSAEITFETMLEDVYECYEDKEYKDLTYKQRKDYVTALQKEMNILFDNELQTIKNTIDKLALLRKENERLKNELKQSHSNAWDFHWDGRGSYEESRAGFYGDFCG